VVGATVAGAAVVGASVVGAAVVAAGAAVVDASCVAEVGDAVVDAVVDALGSTESAVTVDAELPFESFRSALVAVVHAVSVASVKARSRGR
jgi:hypothetical protein